MSTTLPANEMPTEHSAPSSRHIMIKPPPEKRPRSGPLADRLFGWAAKSAAVFTLVVLVAILVSLTISAWPAIAKFGFGFLTSTTWDPVKEDFGGLVMIYGTVMTSAIALLIAVPVSFGIALFLTELSPAWLKRPLGRPVSCWQLCRPSCTACGACWCLARCCQPMCSSRCKRLLAMCRYWALCFRARLWASAFCRRVLFWPS